MPWLRSRTERSSGITTWAIEWREGGRNGKVRARQLGAVTEREARYELAAMNAGKRTRREKRVVAPDRAVEDYLRHMKASGRREGTVEHDRDKLKPLLDAWGHRPLSEWARQHLEALLAERGWATTRVRNAVGVYRRFISWCDQVGVSCGDFVSGYKPPRLRPPEEPEALTADEARRLLSAAEGHHLEIPVALALYAGLSRGDLRVLSWKEIDLDAGLIARPRHKTGRALRLPISPPLREVLERHRRRAGPVCPGLPKSNSSLSKSLHRLCDRAGIPRGGWHRFRHTTGTLLAAAGVDVATIGRILGHRPGSVVTLRYLHTDDERLRGAAETVASALSRAR